MKWTNLNPEELLQISKVMLLQGSPSVQGFPFEILDGFMKRAGIGSGYQEKPCLDPADPDCPLTSPNRGSGTPPDVASTLAQGCYGFAPRFMHWAPDLIIGGQVHNKSGHLVK
jgi:patched 1 protein